MSNINNLTDDLNLVELNNLLKEVKLYRDLKKQLGKRWKKLYSSLKTGEKTFIVEYFSGLSEDAAWENALRVYKEVFELDVNKENVEFVKTEKIKWGIKVYADDKVVDLSYQKIERMITK